MDTSPPLEKRTRFQQAFDQLLGISFLVLFVVLGCHLWNTPSLTSVPTVAVTRTVPTATYWLYQSSREMELVLITDGAATQDPCRKGIVGRFETVQCTLRFADGTVVPWMVHSLIKESWVEVHGRRYPLYGRGYVLLIRANGAEGESTMVHRATMPVFPAGAEGPALEAWMATDPLLAPLAPAFATEP